MVNYRRNRVPGGAYFITMTLADRSSTLLVDEIAALRAAFAETRERVTFHIDAICVLPDHVHLLLTLPEGDADFSRRVQGIKSRFTRACAQKWDLRANARGEYSLWQKRFWEHTIRDEDDYRIHADYIHFNPVKHGHVQAVADWHHSSFHRFVREGIYPLDWGGRDVAGSFGE
jgi:putative transposase